MYQVSKSSISSLFPGLSIHGVPRFPFKNVHDPDWPVIITTVNKLTGSNLDAHSWYTTKSTTLSTHSGLDSLIEEQMAWNGILAQLPTSSVTLGIQAHLILFIHVWFSTN